MKTRKKTKPKQQTIAPPLPEEQKLPQQLAHQFGLDREPIPLTREGLLANGYQEDELTPKGINIVRLVRKFYPTATKKQIDILLWEATCFPMNLVQVRKQIVEIANRFPCPKGDFGVALYIIVHNAYKETDMAMAKYRELEAAQAQGQATVEQVDQPIELPDLQRQTG